LTLGEACAGAADGVRTGSGAGLTADPVDKVGAGSVADEFALDAIRGRSGQRRDALARNFLQTVHVGATVH
jgi:hypothetical protein